MARKSDVRPLEGIRQLIAIPRPYLFVLPELLVAAVLVRSGKAAPALAVVDECELLMGLSD